MKNILSCFIDICVPLSCHHAFAFNSSFFPSGFCRDSPETRETHNHPRFPDQLRDNRPRRPTQHPRPAGRQAGRQGRRQLRRQENTQPGSGYTVPDQLRKAYFQRFKLTVIVCWLGQMPAFDTEGCVIMLWGLPGCVFRMWEVTGRNGCPLKRRAFGQLD